MDGDRREVDLRGARGAQVGDGNVQFNFFVGAARAMLPTGAYLQQVRRLAPPELLGRDRELGELGRFCLDADVGSYAWWRAEPWAGKSALLSTFVLNPPSGVRIVSFFITARLAAQDTRDAFTEALLQQLSAILGQALPAVLPDSTRDAYLLDLMSQAAGACQDTGGRLILVVDGLDEDQGVTAGAGANSIAALLPGYPPSGMRVIVAGRPNPPIPDDVPDWHPLRDLDIVRPLAASPYARNIRRLASQELRGMLPGSAPGRDVAGLLTAARGGLTASDLACLAELPPWEVENVLLTVAGRTFGSRPSPSGSAERPDVHLLAHEELQAQAVAYFGARLDGYRDRLHAWADGYRSDGWPPETPEYLFSGYFRLLEDLGDLPRLTESALDAARHDRMLDLTGSDAAAIAETRSLLDRIAAQDHPDLASTLALACHRDYLADRNAHVPANLPAVWAALGQLPRALALATSISRPDERAKALYGVARALGKARHHEEAATAASTIEHQQWRVLALAGAASALARSGQLEQAEVLAAQAEAAARTIDNPDSREQSLVPVAGALADAGQHEQAVTVAGSITGHYERTRALAAVAGAMAAAGQHEQAETLARSAQGYRGLHVQTLAALARALAEEGQQQQAAALVTQAEAVVGSISWPSEQAEALAALAWALAAAGQHEEAAALAAQAETAARSVDRFYDRAEGLAKVAGTLAAIAGTLAEAGADLQAAAFTAQAEAAASSIDQPYEQVQALAGLAAALAEARQQQQAAAVAGRAEVTARSIDEPEWRARALAGVAGALAEAGQQQQAAAVAAESEATARSAGRPAERARALAAVARALAEAGQRRQAAAVARQAADAASSIDSFSRAQVQAEVAQALAEAGQHRQAEAVARSLSAGYERAMVLAGIARAMANGGQRRRAAAIAGSIGLPYPQALALAGIARALTEAGQGNQVVFIADQAEAGAHHWITSPGDQAQVLALVARALAEAGQRRRAEALSAEAAALAAQAADAARWIDTDEPYERTKGLAGAGPALAEAARALAEVGQHEQAQTVARQALAVVEQAADAAGSFEEPYWQMSLLDTAASALAKIIGELAGVAGAMVRAGQEQQAIALADSIGDLYGQVVVLVAIAGALADAGDYQQAGAVAAQARAVARSVTPMNSQAQALAEVAAVLARLGAAVDASRLAAASCAAGRWETAVRPVLLLTPLAFPALARTLAEQPTESGSSAEAPGSSPPRP